MDTIRNIVRNIAVVILLASFLELLLPNNSMRRFVQLVMGLFVLMAILDPLAGLLHQPLAFDIPAWSSPTNAAVEQDITQAFQQGQSIREQSEKAAMDQYQQVLERQVKALAMTVKGVDKVSTAIKAKSSGEIESLELVVGRTQAAIPPVKPVTGEAKSAMAPSENPSPAQTPEEKRITKDLQTRLGPLLGIDEAKITVSFAAEK